MASFDMINAVGNAYLTSWAERRYLLRMALIPLLIKYICYLISVLYAGNDSIIRLSLIMLPAYFAEGWFLAHWARTIVLNHRWPFRPSGDDRADLDQLAKRGRGILSGMVGFTLINLLLAGYFAFFMSYIPADLDPQTADPKIAIVGMAMMVTSFLGFRLVWIYIPLALNFPVVAYIEKLKPMMSSIYMIGLWLVCFVPTVIVMQLLGSLMIGLAGEGEAPPMLQGMMAFARVMLDMVKNIIVTAGMAYAFIEIFKWQATK